MTDFDFLSDDFDIEAHLANEEKREEIQQLDQLARDCRDELQYAKAEKFSQRAADLAADLNDLSLQVKERFWLAEVQRMQGKYQVALEGFTWLIGVAYDPQQSCQLGEDDLWYVANGFMDFVAVGRFFAGDGGDGSRAGAGSGIGLVGNCGQAQLVCRITASARNPLASPGKAGGCPQ